MTEQGRACESCHYACPMTSGLYECRFDPPIVRYVMRPGAHDAVKASSWPTVDGTDWCGKWAPRPEPSEEKRHISVGDFVAKAFAPGARYEIVPDEEGGQGVLTVYLRPDDDVLAAEMGDDAARVLRQHCQQALGLALQIVRD